MIYYFLFWKIELPGSRTFHRNIQTGQSFQSAKQRHGKLKEQPLMKICGGGANLIYIWIGTSRWVFFSTSPFIKITTPDF